MNHFGLVILLIVTFTLGLVVGDAWTPLSESSTHALSMRCAVLEARVVAVEARCAKLEASIGEASTRLELWFGIQSDAGTRVDGAGGFDPMGL